MKKILVLALALGFVACKSGDKEDGPNLPPVPTATPMPTVAPTPVPEKLHCEKAVGKIYCGNPVWFGLAKCGPGDADGDVYFQDMNEVAEQANKVSSCMRVDGILVPTKDAKFGPCISCARVK